MLVGYARVSTKDQSLDGQLERLSNCEKVFQEKYTGTTSNRPALRECLSFIREGDTLVVTNLDRLARSTVDLLNIMKDLEARSITFLCLDQQIDTSTAVGKLHLNILASFSEFQVGSFKERQKQGIKSAIERGVDWGRKHKLKDEQQANLLNDFKHGLSSNRIAQKYNISRASVYRYLRKMGAFSVNEV